MSARTRNRSRIRRRGSSSRAASRANHARRAPAEEPEGMAALLVGAVEERWEVFLAELRRSRRRCTEGSIHDLRVSTRRLIAVIDVVNFVLPGSVKKGVRRKLRRLLKGFNDLRDLHIRIMHMREMAVGFPVVRALLPALTAREHVLVRQAAGRIAQLKVPAMELGMAQAASALTRAFMHPEMEHAGRVVALAAMGTAFLRAAHRRRLVAPGDPTTIHALRVAFKKFRYTVEVLHPLLPGFTKKRFKAMNAYQVRMGDIQDLEVVGRALPAPGNGRSVPASLLPVYQYLAEKKTELTELFMKSADELFEFWSLTHGSVSAAPRHRLPTGNGTAPRR